jgi:hypothetical protein
MNVLATIRYQFTRWLTSRAVVVNLIDTVRIAYLNEKERHTVTRSLLWEHERVLRDIRVGARRYIGHLPAKEVAYLQEFAWVNRSPHGTTGVPPHKRFRVKAFPSTEITFPVPTRID